jgi:hypothetical protein
MTEQQFESICKEIETSSLGLGKICEKQGLTRFSVLDFIRVNEDGANRYARAKELQMDYLAEEIINISDDSSNDTISTDKGDMENREWVNRSKLKVDTRKWLMSKLAAKKYGDKLDVTSGGDKIAPFVITLTDAPDSEADAST